MRKGLGENKNGYSLLGKVGKLWLEVMQKQQHTQGLAYVHDQREDTDDSNEFH
jgi:hypothetical protein